MTLGFSTKINGKPTCFVEKIWAGLLEKSSEYNSPFAVFKTKYFAKTGLKFPNPRWDFKPKLHTIRADPKTRWKEGNDIHMVINNRTKDRFQFAPVLKVKKVQRIEIDYSLGKEFPIVVIDGTHFYNPKIGINKGVQELAFNDGFESIEAFFDWFKEDFEGKIIHWTDLKY